MNTTKNNIFFIIFLLTFVSTSPLYAQSNVVRCGDVVEGEFTENNQVINHSINLSPGAKLSIFGSRIGDYLRYDIDILAPSSSYVIGRDYPDIGDPRDAETGVLSERGDYLIQLRNSDRQGVYIISIGCTLRDGTIIEPGDPPLQEEQPEQRQAPFSGIGFTGLPPVDFVNAFKLPLSLGAPMPGSIPPSGDAILGLTFDASAGDTFALDFARTSGNLNLGIVVLSANNEVVFQASLVTSQSLSTRLTLPSAGQYTIGVFRIDLLPPATPEATQFQITSTLNP